MEPYSVIFKYYEFVQFLSTTIKFTENFAIVAVVTTAFVLTAIITTIKIATAIKTLAAIIITIRVIIIIIKAKFFKSLFISAIEAGCITAKSKILHY